MPRGGLLDLEKLAFDGAHPGHQAVELGKKEFLVLFGLLDEIGGGAVTDALDGICKLPIQKSHVLLQIQELLMKLGLLEHNRDLTCRRSVLSLSYSLEAGSSKAKTNPWQIS